MKSELEDLFESQVRAWPLLAKGVEGLKVAETRRVRIGWFDVFLRHIPHRIVSTTAAVDPAAVAKRPCFLCADNLPPEEQGLPFGIDYTLYFNPFPILDRHLTIVHREHRRQAIQGQLGSMLELAKDLTDYFIIYNGPECGASAPDHMHFQACSRSLFPIERDAAHRTGLCIPDYCRQVLVFVDSNDGALVGRVEEAIRVLGSITGKQPEPLINLAAISDGAISTVYLFPRSKHRPDVFHSGELTVSPATIDLCGVFVVPLERDFQKITGEDVAAIYKEVTLRDDVFNQVLEKFK